MFRALFIAAPLLAAPLLIVPVAANAAAQSSSNQERCQPEQSSRRSAGRSMLGGLARGMMGRMGGVAAMAIPAAEVLGDAIMNMLDCREQEKAVEATNEAVRGGVGTTVNWTSETRPGVTGSSVATGEQRMADGTHCMTVTDIVIVDGQETRAPKRMCRAPGAARYARA